MRKLILSLAAVLLLVPALARAGNMFEDEVLNDKYAVLGANLAMQTIEGGYKLVDLPTLKKWMDET